MFFLLHISDNPSSFAAIRPSGRKRVLPPTRRDARCFGGESSAGQADGVTLASVAGYADAMYARPRTAQLCPRVLQIRGNFKCLFGASQRPLAGVRRPRGKPEIFYGINAFHFDQSS